MKRPLSMTGFGRGESVGVGRAWTVECRSVNHRFFDTKIKMPWKYAALEEKVKSEVSNYHARGHIDVFVSVSGKAAEQVKLEVNLPLAREYFNCLRAIRRDLSLADDPNLAMVAEYREIISQVEEDNVDLDEIWGHIGTALKAALDEALTMRENEGRALRDDLEARLANFAGIVEEIAVSIPGLVQKKEEAIKERLDKLLQGIDLDPQRLAQEVAVIADKADVTEELVRLRSHINQFSEYLRLEEPVGRRLDFLLQEFLREVNTMASKISDASIAHLSVNLKNELEKMREQVQNLE